jgi:hypothetical protein
MPGRGFVLIHQCAPRLSQAYRAVLIIGLRSKPAWAALEMAEIVPNLKQVPLGLTHYPAVPACISFESGRAHPSFWSTASTITCRHCSTTF